jgi:hypothetical protein
MTVAKRRLTDIKFEHEGAHVALVGKHQGGPANGITTLVFKAVDQITPEQIEKASNVTVTMQFPEFLRKFFGMYWDDAEVLSAAMGYGRTEYPDEDVKDWIDQRVESISIMKSVYRAQDVEKALSELTPDETLAILKDQEMLEQALDNLPEHIKQTQEEPQLETILKSAHEEFVTKAVADAVAIEKASYDAQGIVLKAAQEELSVFKAAQVAAVEKGRKDALTAVVPADNVEALMKSLAPLADEAFDAVVASFAVTKALADQSDMLQETGVNGTGAETSQEVDRTAEILKAKYGKKAQ